MNMVGRLSHEEFGFRQAIHLEDVKMLFTLTGEDSANRYKKHKTQKFTPREKSSIFSSPLFSAISGRWGDDSSKN